MSQFLKSIQPILNEIVYDITGLTLTDRFNPFKKLFEDAIIHRSNVIVERVHVQKELKGLKDKYYVHAQDKKADLVDFLTKHFNNRPLSGRPPDSELHQSCLKFIINIACRPLDVNLDNFTDLLHEQIEESQFDWTKHLLTSVYDQNTILSIDVAHDDDESIDDENDETTLFTQDATENIDMETRSIDDVERRSLTILNEEVITSYWHRNSSNDVSPYLRDFALFWDQTMINNTHLAYRVNCQTLSEYIVIRESLWILLNIYPVHIFTINQEQRIEIVDFIQLCDVSPITLQENLRKIVELANQLNVACRFLSKRMAPCRTLSSFSQVLQQQINRIHYDLANIERCSLRQDSTYTLLSFVEELESLGLFAKGKCIERIFDQLNQFLNQQNCDLTLELIHLLYENLLTAEVLDNLEYFNFFLPLFIASCRIYLEIIESWLNIGALDDPFDEFFIKRKTDVKVDSIEFWSSSLTEQVQNASLIPRWLAKVVPKLIKAGKCAEILEFNQVLRVKSMVGRETSLFDEFLKSFRENLDLDEQTWNPIEILRNSAVLRADRSLSSKFLSIKLTFDDIDDEKNSFLALAFDRMQKNDDNLLGKSRSTMKLKTNRSTNLELILDRFSQTNLIRKSQSLIDRLTEDLFVRMEYLKHMKTIRDFYLFENGSFMHQFSLRLYSKLSQTIHERLDAFTVLLSFETALNMFALDKDKYPLSVLYQSTANEPSSILQKYIIQNVQLKYDLPKELFIIIQPEQLEIYQKSFAFVLQVKQAKYVLDQLVFVEFRVKTRRRNRRLYRHQSYHLHHQMFLLRARLLHAVNAVNNFVLTTFHTAGEEFVKRNQESSIDVESMVDFHEKFLRALSVGALLHPKQQSIRDHLMKLFEIVMIFSRRWQLGFDSIKVEHIEKLTNEFNQTKQFITTVLKPFLPRMIDSPLRALACALQDDFYSIH